MLGPLQPQLLLIPYKFLVQSSSSLWLRLGRGCFGAGGAGDGAGDGWGELLRGGGLGEASEAGPLREVSELRLQTFGVEVFLATVVGCSPAGCPVGGRAFRRVCPVCGRLCGPGGTGASVVPEKGQPKGRGGVEWAVPSEAAGVGAPRGGMLAGAEALYPNVLISF